jgi:NAD(P)-dependent dehydrogenase (short-subunit alcohol dehydrogenase family)
MRLANQTAIVTGAASGIGKAIAQAFVREGAAVAVLDINRPKGESVVADLNRQGGRTCFVECDVVIIENLRLRDVAAGLYELIAAPVNLQGVDGGWCRALLRLES